MPNIYLCGFMGCGKSTVGKALAAILNRPFHDLDDYIVERQGKSIPQIFAEDGEPAFRRMESNALDDLPDEVVVALGGGTLMHRGNIERVKHKGQIVLLDAPFELCYQRIRTDANRPVAARSTEDELRLLYSRRRQICAEAADYMQSIPLEDAGPPEACAYDIVHGLGLDSP